MLSWQIRTAAPLAVGRQVWQRLGCLASACPRRSTLPVAVRNQKSQTGPHGWASSLSYFLHVTGQGAGASFLWPAAADEVISPRHTSVPGTEQQVPNPKSGGASCCSTQRGMSGYGYKNLGDPAWQSLSSTMDLDPFPDPIFSWQKDLWGRRADNGEMRSSCRGLNLTLNSDNHQLESQGPRHPAERLRGRRAECCAIRPARVISHLNETRVTSTSFSGRPLRVQEAEA